MRCSQLGDCPKHIVHLRASQSPAPRRACIASMYAMCTLREKIACKSVPRGDIGCIVWQRCNRLCQRRAACTASRAPALTPPRCTCAPPLARACTNGAPSPEPHHRRAAQPSLHTHDAATPVTRRRDAPPRVTAAPRATLVAHARPWHANTSPPPRAQRALHSRYHAQTKNQP